MNCVFPTGFATEAYNLTDGDGHNILRKESLSEFRVSEDHCQCSFAPGRSTDTYDYFSYVPPPPKIYSTDQPIYDAPDSEDPDLDSPVDEYCNDDDGVNSTGEFGVDVGEYDDDSEEE